MIAVTVDSSAAASLVRGHPWLFRDAIRGVRGSKPKTGDVVELCDPRGETLGLALYDAESPLAARVYERRKGVRIDAPWFVQAVERAAARRDGFFDPSLTNAYRLVNGEGDRIPGLVLDRYDDVVIARTDGDAIDEWFPRFVAGLRNVLGPRGVRTLAWRIDAEGGERKILEQWGGEAPDTIDVLEHGMTLEVDLAFGQKTGAFLDQRENRRRVRELSTGRRVLNLFSYAGGFSLAAALGGAKAVTSVDIAGKAHASAQRSFRKNGLDPGAHRFVTGDAFTWLEEAKRRGERFDLVISDPPSFAPNEKTKKKALAAYAKLHRACAALLDKGGLFAAASCSSHVSMEELLGTLDDTALGRSDLSLRETFGPPADHPTLPSFPEGRYLKLALLG